MSGYVYKITNLMNNKWYIGSHKSNKIIIEDCINDGYWGSGIVLELAIKKHGLNNFKKEILIICNDYGYAEAFLLNILDAKNHTMSYNLKNEAYGGITTLGKVRMHYNGASKYIPPNDIDAYLRKGYIIGMPDKYKAPRSIETKQKISQKRLGKLATPLSKRTKSVINLDTQEIFTSLKDAANSVNGKVSILWRTLNGQQKTYKSFQWQYYNSTVKQKETITIYRRFFNKKVSKNTLNKYLLKGWSLTKSIHITYAYKKKIININTLVIYESISDASKQEGIAHGTLLRILSGEYDMPVNFALEFLNLYTSTTK